MQHFFDTVNVYLLSHRELLDLLSFLFWLKSWLLFLVMSVFLFLIYREDWRQRRQSAQCAKYRLTA